MTAVCSPHNDSKTPLLKATPPQIYIEPSSHVLVFYIERPYGCYQKIKINTKTASTPLIYNSVLLHDILGNGGTNLEETNQYLNWLKAQPIRQVHNGNAHMTKNQRLDNSGKNQIPNNIGLTKVLPVIFCHTHRSDPCSAVTREALSCSRWEQVHKPRTRQFAESERSWDTQP